MKFDNRVLSERAAFALRLSVGIGFGLGLAALGHFGDLHIYGTSGAMWGLTAAHEDWQPVVYTTLALSAFVWWAAAGTMHRLSLALWGVAAMALIALLALHQVATNAGRTLYAFTDSGAWLILPLLFIAHELVSGADRSGRLISPYATYFDQAWKHGVQLLLSVLFTGLFWAILWLGAALLRMIGFHWFEDLLRNSWFCQPACGAAMACAVQLGDVQDKLLSHVRAVVLSVLAWLLPVIAAIGLLFLCSLCVSGLEPLWKTKAATATLLGACVAFVLLINAAYQQGDAERPVNIVLKWAARLACFLLLAFALLAADSLWLRVDQYGLTAERVLAGAGAAIAVLFGAGYAMAAVVPGRWLRWVEPINIAMAFVKGVIFLGLLTPVADPSRLGVADQVARLQSGRTPLAQFDWRPLRFETGRYGVAALADLGKSGKTADIRAAAARTAALKDSDRWEAPPPFVPPEPDDVKKLKVVYPAGAALPATFTANDLAKRDLLDCVRDESRPCTAALVDLDGDGTAEIVVLKGRMTTAFTYQSGQWQGAGQTQFLDDDDVKAFNAGKIAVQRPRWGDLIVGGKNVSERDE